MSCSGRAVEADQVMAERIAMFVIQEPRGIATPGLSGL